MFSKHCTEGAGEALPIHSEAPIPHVMKLNLLAHAALEGRRIAVGGLPWACDARGDAQQFPLLIFGEVLLQFVARDGARADNGQIALEHVEKLRHLLDGAHTDELAHLCDAWVGTDLALNLALVELDGAQTLLHITGIRDHATKPKHANHPASPANALPRVDRTDR